MSPQPNPLEINRPTVDEAIAAGLARLGLPREAVEVEILDAGSKGLFGLGARYASVRLTVKSGYAAPPQPSAEPPAPPPAATPAPPPPPKAAAPKPAPKPAAEPASPEEEDHVLTVARETLGELLEKMHIQAEVQAYFDEEETSSRRPAVIVEIAGEDLSILIGPRGETLDALQYISRLIVGKELGQSVLLAVDVEGFRKRRAGALRSLALRMAEQAISTGRRQVLEPMPANERRIIHMELRSHPKVTTESIGEGDQRKVTILPKTR